MRWRSISWLAPLWGLLSLTSAAQTRYVIRPTPTGSITDVDGRHALTLLGPLDNQDRGIYIVTAPSNIAPEEVIAEVGTDPEVADIELDAKLALTESPTSLNQSSVAILDSMPAASAVVYYGTPVLGLYLSQPSASIIRLPDAQTTFATTGAGIVAIIDTGVDTNHSALRGALVPGYDFVHNIAGSGSELVDLAEGNLAILTQSNPEPSSKTQQLRLSQSTVAILDQSTVAILDTTKLPEFFGHGTMVAGVVHFVAPTAKIMPLKAFDGDGTAKLSDILRAIYYAADNDAHVVNMSFSLLIPSVELASAVDYANEKGVIMVASTGNTGTNFVANPAAMNEVMGVASTTNNDTRSQFSSYGTGTFVAAPGEQVITLYPGQNYAVASGTSFSAPMVAGTAALAVQVNSEAHYSGASMAVSQAKPLSSDLGHGRLDVYQAMQYATANLR
jgi:subtilisin family serine protease